MRNYGQNDIRNTERIPKHLLESLEAYVKSGRPLGKTMRTMVANDFYNGVLLGADQETLIALPAIILYMYNDMPHLSHGSYEVYELYSEYHTLKHQVEKMVSPTEEHNRSLDALYKKLNIASNVARSEYRTWNS